mmetsp:Transcript_47697/g.120080  ORF Transcript_47697/g.120080 Transcript_47697/m.120080 type:complete len:412 (-) Transcript_47697:138-1373(-)|eukprot:CAMPEP_0177640904 /NCGR_PEP_ID=MMETSP0447-20121125/6791_1 /TAXON_ID=0 /ORGANISM="Stygamoeba regulata, Strain BSH-02190019" /LENGTH=411 /DNA_ID=CAMNT_0019143005 /DNA_START=167 /DNA_END=1402 /DNA_ORIENTATION=+
MAERKKAGERLAPTVSTALRGQGVSESLIPKAKELLNVTSIEEALENFRKGKYPNIPMGLRKVLESIDEASASGIPPSIMMQVCDALHPQGSGTRDLALYSTLKTKKKEEMASHGGSNSQIYIIQLKTASGTAQIDKDYVLKEITVPKTDKEGVALARLELYAHQLADTDLNNGRGTDKLIAPILGQFYEATKDNHKFYILLELYDMKSLFHVAFEKNLMPPGSTKDAKYENYRKAMAYVTCRAVDTFEKLLEKGYFPRDVNMGSLLFQKGSGLVSLCDFGFPIFKDTHKDAVIAALKENKLLSDEDAKKIAASFLKDAKTFASHGEHKFRDVVEMGLNWASGFNPSSGGSAGIRVDYLFDLYDLQDEVEEAKDRCTLTLTKYGIATAKGTFMGAAGDGITGLKAVLAYAA